MQVLTTAEVAQRWAALAAHVSQWYSDPDLEALEIALCCYASHYFLQEDPIWLFVIGPPSTGKTGIVVSCLSALPKVHVLSDLTPTTWLSGFGRGSKRYSLLHRIAPETDPSAIVVFKDFTSFLARREDTRKELASQLREIHDGYYSRPCGSSTKTLDWRGKLTVIAACTPALERAWGVNKELGDRFLSIRWSRGNGSDMAFRAACQIFSESSIKSEMHHLVRQFMDPTGSTPAAMLPAEQIQQVAALTDIVAHLRANVIRDSGGTREIVCVPEPEGTARMAKAVCQLAKARATIRRKPQADVDDLRVVRRALIQAVTLTRLRIFEAIPIGASVRWTDIQQLTEIPDGTLSRELEELMALHVLRDSGTSTYCFTDFFQHLHQTAFPL